MTRREQYNQNLHWFNENWEYKMLHHSKFNYAILQHISFRYKTGRKENCTYNDAIIMADTETSKKYSDQIYNNHVCAWTISIRAFNRNIVTLYGHKPSTMVGCIRAILNAMQGEETYIYFHNLSYDYVFIRKFLFEEFGYPVKQLITKSHYPIFIKWENGLILRDSLILAQRSLEKWANDLNVEHKKAVGCWDYDIIRNQNYIFSDDELKYIENDTLSGVECIQILMDTLHKSIYSMPYTATGIPREEVRKRGKSFNAHSNYVRQALTFEQQMKLEQVYHGGYTHTNRHIAKNVLLEKDYGLIKCYDFASSYPFVMLSEKYACEKFFKIDNCKIDKIIRNSDDYCFMFKLILIKPKLKNDNILMPALQYSKCTKIINPVLDNGRILCCEYCEIYITEQDAIIINEQYDINEHNHICVEVETARKDYLPRWFSDYVYSLFEQKTFLKGGDPVLYNIAKAKLNSLYGLCVQKPCKPEIMEIYETGEYKIDQEKDIKKEYEKYVKRRGTVLQYHIGVWVTAYAFKNLHVLGSCCNNWFYSDTDSCYGSDWNEEKLTAYNNKCKKKLLENGYGPVIHNGREYWLGIAEFDGSYSEYCALGAKRYSGRDAETGKLKITVAGVPKKGVICLNDDIHNFKKGTIFSGEKTGKKTHTYFYVDEIYIDQNGNETGDSIDLSPCDYLLDDETVVDWETIYNEEIGVQVYDEV